MSKEYEVKYIHIFYGHDLKFSRLLIEAFNDPKSGINQADHMFVLLYKQLFDEMEHHQNVVLDESGSNLLIKYGRKCKWLISYGLPSSTQVLLTPRAIRKKTIYRYGGGSRTTHLVYEKGKVFHNIKTFFKQHLFNSVMKSFAAIGVANTVDIIDLSKIIKNGKYVHLHYAYGSYGQGHKAVLAEIRKRGAVKRDNGIINILLGHRGTSENNHIEILKKLEHFNKDKIKIYIPLSYGNPEYIEGVKKYLEEKKYDNVVVIDSFMEYKDYASLLYTMDIGIFDGFTSYALGNIRALLNFRRTVFLRKTGVLAEAFDYEGVPYKLIEEIENMSFDEFTAPVKYVENGAGLINQDIDESKVYWDRFFEEYK